MKKSYLENLYFNKTHRPVLKKLQKTKKLFQQTTKKTENFFNELNTSFVLNNKLFWKTVKPSFSNKGSHRDNIKLVEGDKLLEDDSEVAEELNKPVYQIFINWF